MISGDANEQQRDRRNPDGIASPNAAMRDLVLADLIDAQELQALMDDFYGLAHVPMSIIDLTGRMLVGVGWQKVCLLFHRAHPVARAHCLESDLLLSAGVPSGEYKLYRCRNNMWDIATPIVIGGQHMGNIFSGQFFFDDELPDYEHFRAQARQYGFAEDAYISALEQAPRLSRETVDRAMSFFVKLAHMISRLGYSNIQLARALTEREALMESLRAGEQRWATTLASVGDGVIATDVSGKITFLNRVAEELTGWALSEAVQQPLENIFPIINEHTRQTVDNPVSKVLQTGTNIGLANHTLLLRKDGSEIAIEDSGAPIRGAEEQITGAVLVFRDSTERRRAEREQAWLASFPLFNPNPILEISQENRIEYANRKVYELFPDLPGLSTAHPYLTGWDEIVAMICSNPALEIHREVQVGDRYYQQSIYYNQEYGRIRTYGMDITERKQAELALSAYAEKLKRQNRDLQDFAFLVSHDLQEPLRKLEVFSDMFLAESTHLTKRQLELLERMQNGAGRMRSMLQGLLQLSRLTTQVSSLEYVNLNEVTAAILADRKPQIEKSGAQIKVGLLPLVEADPTQMRQLLEHLIDNAVKFHVPGHTPQVAITARQLLPDQVEITVEDNGIGFDMAHAGKLFQPFQRLVGRHEYEGSGVGLALSRKIVELNNGTITAQSSAGQGATFMVTLPIRQRKSKEQKEIPAYGDQTDLVGGRR